MTGIHEPTYQNPDITRGPVLVDGRELILAETADFPRDDPWSRLTRTVIANLAAAGQFDGRNILEAGLGDGRNIFAAGFAGNTSGHLIGVELDGWRLELARENLATVGVDHGRVSLHEGDIIDWLDDSKDQLTGWAFACLPQAPGNATINDADGYQDTDSLAPFRDLPLGKHTVDVHGLTLNAAYLARLRERVQPGDFDALVTLSGRVPEPIVEELFAQTGWQVVERFEAPDLVQQDPDTGVAWVGAFDDGQRFYERRAHEAYTHISAGEAEARRIESLALFGGSARDVLNVYHGLSVYHLQPEARSENGN